MGATGAPLRARDLFAGAGGWDVAARGLGWQVHGVEIMPEARATRDAADLPTIPARPAPEFVRHGEGLSMGPGW